MQPLMGMRRTNQGRQVEQTQYAEEAPESDLHQSTAQSRFDSVRGRIFGLFGKLTLVTNRRSTSTAWSTAAQAVSSAFGR